MSKVQVGVSSTIIVRDSGEVPILLELKDTQYAISRMSDIALVNNVTLPELLTVFQNGLTEVTKALSQIGLEINKAKRKLAEVKSDIVVNEMPKFLAERNLKSSEDVREAVINSHSNYLDAVQFVADLEVLYETAKSHYRNLEHAIHNCKNIVNNSPSKVHHTDYSNKEFSIGQG